jgi:acetoin utilization protein AcuC
VASGHRLDRLGGIAGLTEGEDPTGQQPLVIFGDVSVRYDFGPHHPLTPRRFGPSIDLMRSTGATNFVEPREATDEELGRLHTPEYIRTVRAFGSDSDRTPAAGIGPGDCPPFDDMHVVSASVAGGSIDAIDRILSGEVEHAFHPGGGLHHAMAARASGFCIYNDVALAVARARDAGHRVLYVDVDVHHGDGTQALFWDDPNVLTFSIHESGLSLFPGTGFTDEQGGPGALGTAVNVPLQPYSGDASWIAAVEKIVPALADAFRPTFLVTQHGCDTHVYDPLAHLRLTTRAYRSATTLLDAVAHDYCAGRWLATGGGGYDAYRVVPRSWSLVWLAQAHREPSVETDEAWRARWTVEAEENEQSPPPELVLDPVELVSAETPSTIASNQKTAESALKSALEHLRRAA